MTRNEKINLIHSKCIEANSEIIDRSEDEGILDIRLADVLLAIGEGRGERAVFISARGYFGIKTAQDTLDITYGLGWDLRKDNLTDQSDECITFLNALLQ